MSAQRLNFTVVADSEDDKAKAGKVPVFSIGDMDYFHGDTFTMPNRWNLNMDNFAGNGFRFSVPYSVKDEATGEETTEWRNMILPLRLNEGQELPVAGAAPESVAAETPTPKKSAGKKAQ